LLPVYDISRPPIKVVALDANAKLTRYSHLGHAHTTAQPVFGTFFGAAHNLVQQAVQDGTITSAALAAAQQADTEQATEEATAAAGDCPHPNLSCARQTARKGGVLDCFGVAGACCAHGFPLEQCFISMPTPEQFAFYDTILNDVILQERTIMDLDMDMDRLCCGAQLLHACSMQVLL
jgi:hypothetical protein